MDGSLPCILTFLPTYLPGYKAGGPVRSIANMVQHMSSFYQYWVVTGDRDLNDTAPYPGVQTGTWNPVGPAMVYYAAPGTLGRNTMARLIAEVRPDLVYLNGYFNKATRTFLIGRRLGMARDIPVVLAPRGEFSPGALGLKGLKKRLYNALTPPLGLYNGLIWQASSPVEESEIRACLGNGLRVHVAPNLPRQIGGGELPPLRAAKPRGSARVVFLSRISRKKNLEHAVESLRGIRGEVEFDIYGPIESEPYWASCQAAIRTLPANVHVAYRGSLQNERVFETLSSYDLMILPTLGENFGHVIYESFTAGCPVLISDRTPWRKLADHDVGWDLGLNDHSAWQRALQICIDRDENAQRAASAACLAFAREWAASSDLLESHLRLFGDAMIRDTTGLHGRTS